MLPRRVGHASERRRDGGCHQLTDALLVRAAMVNCSQRGYVRPAARGQARECTAMSDMWRFWGDRGMPSVMTRGHSSDPARPPPPHLLHTEFRPTPRRPLRAMLGTAVPTTAADMRHA